MKADVREALGFVARGLKAYRGLMIPLVGLSALGAALAVCVPIAAGWATTRVLNSGDAATIAGLGLLGLLAARLTIQVASSVLSAKLSHGLEHDTRSRLHKRLLGLPLYYHHTQPHGDRMAILTYDVSTVTQFVSVTPAAVFEALLVFVGATFVFLRTSVALGAAVLVLAPIAYVIARVLGNKVRAISSRYWSETSRLLGEADQDLKTIWATKAFVQETHRADSYDATSVAVRDLGIRRSALTAIVGPTTQFVVFAGMVFIVVGGSANWLDVNAAPGELVAILLMGLTLTSPLRTLSNTYAGLESVNGALARIAGSLAVKVENIEDGKRPHIKGQITFKNLGFGYPGRNTVFSDLNFGIEAGESVALLGSNGCGKTTLVQLLSRLHEPQSGQILVDGVDVTAISLAHLRRNIAYVPQHTQLLNATIRDNVTFGRPSATEVDLNTAADLALLSDFIQTLPDGWNTMVGDDGVALSGGQRQRIALARAILMDAPILVLDEATSNFDQESETEFLQRAADFLASRTTLIITHRTEALSLVDRVWKFNDSNFAPEIAADKVK